MARATLTTEPSKVYVGMLAVTILAMLVGITVLALEADEYDWEQTPRATPKAELPKEPVAAPGGAAIADPVDAKPVAAVNANPAIPPVIPAPKQVPALTESIKPDVVTATPPSPAIPSPSDAVQPAPKTLTSPADPKPTEPKASESKPADPKPVAPIVPVPSALIIPR
jgi:hypothetical protein